MERDELHELTAAYALDALDPADAAAYEEHLSRCPACRDELASFRGPVGLLAFGADPAEPPSALRGRVLAQARAERPKVVPLRPRWAFPAAAAVAAVAAGLAIAFGIWGFSVSSDLDAERSARAAEEQALAIALDPSAEHFRIDGAEGTLAVAPDGRGALVLTDLAAAPEGMVYEAWVSDDGETMLPAGTFRAGEARTVVGLERPVPAGGLVAVTLEEGEGATSPTSDPLFVAETA